MSARCFMRRRGRRIGLRGHRGRQVRRPTAQSGRRSSARGLLCPLCACCVRAGLDYGVHETGDFVYGTVRKSCLVHQIGDSVYGDKDYDKNGQEKGAYFGAVWCMGLCHEVVRRTRNGRFGVRDRAKGCARVVELVLIHCVGIQQTDSQ